MRFDNPILIRSVVNSGTVVSKAIPTIAEVSGSFQISFTDSSATGTFVMQASNDPLDITGPSHLPVNWSAIPNASSTIIAGATSMVVIPSLNFRWIRASFTSTGGAGTFSVTGFMFGNS